MTIQYLNQLHSSKAFLFLTLLRRWRGGVLKLVWVELIILSVLYTALSLVYRYALTDRMQDKFEVVVNWTNSRLTLVPVIFILSFYISTVFKRFCKFYQSIPWTTNLALNVLHHIKNEDPSRSARNDAFRKTILRRCNAAFVLAGRDVCKPVLERYPDTKALVSAKLLAEEEAALIDKTEARHPLYFLPLSWAADTARQAEAEGFIPDKFGLCKIVQEINKLREGFLSIVHLNFVALPLVYTQVVFIAVYSYVLLCVLGRQYLVAGSKNNVNNSLDIRVPFFTLIETIVYLSCLKVAASMLNPMGNGDDDFEMNSIIDFCLETSKSIVESGDFQLHETIKDSPWDLGDTFDDTTPSNRKTVHEKLGDTTEQRVANLVVS